MNENTLTLNTKTYKAELALLNNTALAGKVYPMCQGCAFDDDTSLCADAQRVINCVAEYRTDNHNIIWIEKK